MGTLILFVILVIRYQSVIHERVGMCRDNQGVSASSLVSSGSCFVRAGGSRMEDSFPPKSSLLPHSSYTRAHVYFYIYIYIYLPGRPLSQERPLKTHPSPSDGVHRNMAACDTYARVKKFTRGVDFIQRTFYLTVNRPIGGDLGFGTLCSLDHRVRARTHLYFWIFSVSLQHALFSGLIPSKQGDLREEEQPPAILYERHSCLSEFPGYGGEENGNLHPRHIRKEYRCVS